MTGRRFLTLLSALALIAGVVFPAVAPSVAQASPTVIPVLNCYAGAKCTNAQYAADDVSLACSRTTGFLGVEYDAATTPAPTTADKTNIADAFAYAYDAFQRVPSPSTSAFTTEMEDLYYSVTSVQFPPQWRIYTQDLGRYGRIPINTERVNVDAVCQDVD